MNYYAKVVLGDYEVESSTAITFSVGPYTVTLGVYRGLAADGGIIIAPRCHRTDSGRRVNTDIIRREFPGSYRFEDGHNTVELIVSIETSLIEC